VAFGLCALRDAAKTAGMPNPNVTSAPLSAREIARQLADENQAYSQRTAGSHQATSRGYAYTSIPKDSQRTWEDSQRTWEEPETGQSPEFELNEDPGSWDPGDPANGGGDPLIGESPSMQEYREITRNATEIEDINADCWGALFFVVVSDFPDMKVGRISAVGKVRFFFSFAVFILNLFIQGILLYFICTLLMMPGILEAQNVYKYFTTRAFRNGVMDDNLFLQFSAKYKNEVCGLALSQAIFARVILFLWVTNNVGELRNNYIKMQATMGLPTLPDGLDMRLMVLDGSDAETDSEHGGRVVCLNQGSKMLLLMFIFIPKVIISVLLATTGCLWLMAAENIGDLILNSLALAFVVQVDELIAQVFFPQFYLQDLARLGIASQKEVDDPEIVQVRQLKSFCFSSLTLVVTALVVEGAMRFQPVIPFFNGHEVSEACTSYIANQVPWCMPGNSSCFSES